MFKISAEAMPKAWVEMRMMLLRSSQYHYFQTIQGINFPWLKFTLTEDTCAGEKNPNLGNLRKMLILLQLL